MDDKNTPKPEKSEITPDEKPANESPACPYCDAPREVCPLCMANMSIEDDD